METIIEEEERESIQNNENIKAEENIENKKKVDNLPNTINNEIENRTSNFQAINRFTQFNESLSNVVETYQKENENDLIANEEDNNIENINLENNSNGENNNINANTIKENNNNNNNIMRIPTRALTEYKIIMLGDFGVGKSSLIYRYLNNKFKKDIQENSPKSENNIKVIQIDENLRIKLNIWDTAGMEKEGKIFKKYYVDSYGVLFVFDLTNKKSFDNLKIWINDSKANCPKDIVYCFVGNKSDLTNERVITYEEIKDFLQDNLFYEVSSKNGNNVSLAFEQLAYNIIEKQNEEKDNPDKVLRGKEGRKTTDLNNFNEVDFKQKKGCC